MTPVWGADEHVAAWVAGHIEGGARGFGECRAMGVVNAEGKPVAGVVFHDWSPERGLIEVSCAATDSRWLTRGVVRAVMNYGFAVARVITTRTAEGNRPVRRIWRALNATEYALAGLWGPDEAMMIYTLTPAQWRSSRLFGG